MSQQQQEEVQQQQLYPPPPHYFHQVGSGLQPPPPIEGTYQLFGELYTTEDGLPPLQVRRLYDTRPDGTIDFRGQLLALHRELVANVLELLAVLVDKPSGYARQVENVGLILRNMQHLANNLRPHQARATLVDALRHEAEAKTAATERLQQACDSAEAALQSAVEALRQAASGGSDKGRESNGILKMGYS